METGVAYASIDPDGEDRFQRLRQELGVSTFGLNLLRLRAGERSRIHRHLHQEEVYLVLEGRLTLLVEDEPTVLERGALARVAPDVRRQLVNRERDPLLLLALGGANAHEGRDGRAYRAWDEEGEGHSPADVPFPENIAV
jgi:uncharacterized cupin superfamily protein